MVYFTYTHSQTRSHSAGKLTLAFSLPFAFLRWESTSQVALANPLWVSCVCSTRSLPSLLQAPRAEGLLPPTTKSYAGEQDGRFPDGRRCSSVRNAPGAGSGSGAHKVQAASPLWSNSYWCYMNNIEEFFKAHHEAVHLENLSLNAV